METDTKDQDGSSSYLGPGYCKRLEENQDMLLILMWLFSMPLAGVCCGLRVCLSKNAVRLLVVFHSNVSFWSWVFLILSIFSFCNNQSYQWNHKHLIICMGIFFLVLSIMISLLSALTTDKLYPDCKVSHRDLKNYLEHCKDTDPEIILSIKSHSRQRTNYRRWRRARKEFIPQNWTETYFYPEIEDLNLNQIEKARFYKIDLNVLPDGEQSRDDLHRFIWNFGREHGMVIVPEDGKYYSLISMIQPPKFNKDETSLVHTYSQGLTDKFPSITTVKSIRLFVSNSGTMPTWLDLTLRFAWILNLFGFSSIVLAALIYCQSITSTISLTKKFKSPEIRLIEALEAAQFASDMMTFSPPPPPSYFETVSESQILAQNPNATEPPPSYESVVE